MHLVFLSAYRLSAGDQALDLIGEKLRVRRAMDLALEPVGVFAAIHVESRQHGMTATVYCFDADTMLEVLTPVFRADPLTASGIVLVRYGEPGAPERQVFLGDAEIEPT